MGGAVWPGRTWLGKGGVFFLARGRQVSLGWGREGRSLLG